MGNKGIIFGTICILLGAIFRILPHPPNATPVAAMALVGGIYLNRKWLAFALPFVILLISDIILNNTVNKVFFTDQTGFILFSDYMVWTYLAFGLTVIIGMFLKRRSIGSKILGGALFSSLGFFFLTNFGTWLSSGLYPSNAGGLMASFIAAIPFFQNTLISNFVFISLFVLTIEGALAFAAKRQVTS